MNIISIMIKECYHIINDKKSMAFLILFPMVLMTVLGAALSGAFDKNLYIKDIKIAYVMEKDADKLQFNNFIADGKKSNIKFYKINNVEEGKKDIKSNYYSAFVDVKKDSLELYKNDKHKINSGIVEAYLKSYVQRYNEIMSIVEVNPAYMRNFKSDSKNYVELKGLKSKKTPSSVDYYSVTMLTLIILYSANNSAWGMKGEKTRNTWSRMLCAPVSKYELFFGKLFGQFIITSVQMIIVFIFSKYVLKADWGSNLLDIAAILGSQIAMAISVGAGTSMIVKEGTVMGAIIQTVIPFIAFFGGAYTPISTGPKDYFFNFLINLSPVHWVNKSIFSVIYDNNSQYIPQTLMINLGIVAVMLIAALIFSNKEEV